MKRAPRSGCLFQRKDGRWAFIVELPKGSDGRRRRKTYYAWTTEEAEAKAHAAHPFLAEPRQERTIYPSRTACLTAARELGSHTRRQWWAKVHAAGWRCHYCGADVSGPDALVKEHKVPISRGGSDALDNVVPACRPCNDSKGDRTPEEWTAERGAA